MMKPRYQVLKSTGLKTSDKRFHRCLKIRNSIDLSIRFLSKEARPLNREQVLIGVQPKLQLSQPSFKTATTSDSQDKMLREEHSHIDTLMSFIKMRLATITQLMNALQTPREKSIGSLLQILTCQSLLFLDLSMDMLRHIPTPLSYGKHNLEILPTVLK